MTSGSLAKAEGRARARVGRKKIGGSFPDIVGALSFGVKQPKAPITPDQSDRGDIGIALRLAPVLPSARCATRSDVGPVVLIVCRLPTRDRIEARAAGRTTKKHSNAPEFRVV